MKAIRELHLTVVEEHLLGLEKRRGAVAYCEPVNYDAKLVLNYGGGGGGGGDTGEEGGKGE